MGRLNEKGHEVLDNTPVVMPLGMKKPVDIQTMIQRQIIRALGEQQSRSGMETFEEADDFDVEDEVELKSAYELQDVPDDQPKETKKDDKAKGRRKIDSQDNGDGSKPTPGTKGDSSDGGGNKKPPKSPAQAPEDDGDDNEG